MAVDKSTAGTPMTEAPRLTPRPLPREPTQSPPPVEDPGNVVPARHGQVVGIHRVAGEVERAAAPRSERSFSLPAAAASPRTAASRRRQSDETVVSAPPPVETPLVCSEALGRRVMGAFDGAMLTAGGAGLAAAVGGWQVGSAYRLCTAAP